MSRPPLPGRKTLSGQTLPGQTERLAHPLPDTSGRKIGGADQLLPGKEGVGHRQVPGVQGDASVLEWPSRPVAGIAQDEPAPVGELRPDLVLASRPELDQENRMVASAPDRLVAERRESSPRGARRDNPGISPASPLHAPRDQIVLQNTLCRGRWCGNHGQIPPLDRALRQGTVNSPEGFGGSRENHRSAHGLVDPVDRLKAGVSQGVPEGPHHRLLPGVSGLNGLARLLGYHGEP
ncbi:hypothetical protein AU468_14320 [Alkalispirochaeta sphaeroplastigenens]|uniref:Uncharacterized protein n=1 Tax=Alkalispirochaeta sphaeroplastigenens TaxID=1187066 RepID=A0A2S4JF65_9SPIO|nr:hypothetical protein AU468_14320 [Alkalispirochaeta sphaeroplastigenens]